MFELGWPEPKFGKPVFEPLRSLAEFDGRIRARNTAATEYWIKCTLTGDAALSALRLTNDLQMAPLAMPAMTVGNNRFTYLEHTDNNAGPNAARHLRLTHTWVERSKTHPPAAPAAPVAPANGGQPTARTSSSRGPPATRGGTAITDYHFQLAERPVCRWPLSPTSTPTPPAPRRKAGPGTPCPRARPL